ncbi:hypothetical protein B0H14DRAFT_3869681 [Mycena olivaceomarginata]|nr:hypothetical protein B0H14DRAFT_3869681 [Mycena olivaceomarginata]
MNLESHCASDKCVARSTRASTAPPIPSPRKVHTPACSTNSVNQNDCEDEEDNDDNEFEFQHGRSSSVPPELPSSFPPAPLPMVVVQTCPGSALDWPVDVGPFMETFPFHRIGVQPGSLSFDVEIHDRGTKSLNSVCNFATAVRKLADYKRFMDAVAGMDIPRLRQLVSVGLRRGSSPAAIVRMMQSALEGVYRPRPTETLYTVNHSLGLPSLCTLRNHMAFTKVMPTVGTISVSDIIHNIREVVLGPCKAAAIQQPLRGVSFMINEVALEERANHFRHNNSIGGLCWRHSAKVNLQLKTYTDAVKISEKIKAGEVHLGKEMTVVSVSCFGESGTYPILALPTCKFVGPEESKLIYETVTEAWLENTKNEVGMPWSWAMDSKSSCRRAGYNTFVKHKLPSGSPIFGTLASMAGLNIFTGLHSITLDFNYKHIFKRICTLIRSAAGMALCNGRIINPVVLTRFLAHDPQDVPHTVELMEAVIEFLAYDFGQVSADTAADLDFIRLLALLLKSILVPFITPDMLLTEQMTHLSTYAHLTFTLFRLNCLTFMSNQLYGDSQSMIKNAFFCLAKQQQLDPTQPFYLFQVGDDPLKKLFGKLCMLGGHNSAMSYAQAIERLGHACDLQSVYLRQPDLNQGQRRISMSCTEAWDDGAKTAQQILAKLHFPAHSYNYTTIFNDEKVDMLCPFGDDKYPGVESDVDRSIITTAKKSTTSTATPSSSTSTSAITHTLAPSTPAPTPAIASSAPSTSTPNSPPFSTSPLSSSIPPHPPIINITETSAAPNDDDDLEDEGNSIPFEDTLDEIPELALPVGRGVDPNNYLNVEGKWVHKQRICRVVINTDFEPKSTERLKRVRGHTKVNAKKCDDVNPEAILGVDTFIVGDPFFTLLRTDQTLSLAVLRCTAIHEDNISRRSILATTVRNPKAQVKLSGQVLSLTMVPTLNDRLPELESTSFRPQSYSDVPSSDTEDKSPWSWIWNGGFLKVDAAIAGTKQTTKKVVIVSVPGVLTELVNHWPVDAVPRLGERAYEINSEGRSWELDNGPMGAVCKLLWDVMVTQKIPLTNLASVKKAPEFPYAFDNGKPALVCAEGTQQLIQQHDGKVQCTCHLCGEHPGNWRAHISTHILRSIRGLKEVLCAVIRPILPCGFCAASGKPECAVYIRKKGPTTHVETNCALVSAFNYKPADQGSKSTPCHNVPVVCKLCFPDAPRPSASQPAQWCYNMPEHLSIAHPEYASPLNPRGTRLPHEVWVSMEVEEAEELPDGLNPNRGLVLATMSAQIYSLPEELLVAIVTAEQEDRRARAVGLEPTRTVFNSEWALSHTSRRFRDAIVGAPALWTLIEINLDLWKFPGCVEIPKLIAPEDHGFTKGLREILPHVERLWKFAIILHTRSAAKIVNLNDDPIGMRLFASGAPRLSFLRIDGLKLQLPAPSWTVALTHLELRKSQRADDNSVLVAITAQCPSLVHLHIDLSWLRVEASHSRFCISTLKSLNISVPFPLHGDLFPLPALIDFFETPALAEFIIEGAHGDEIVDLFNSSSLPHASFPALTTLSFIHISPCTCDVDLSLDTQLCYPPPRSFPPSPP